MVLAVSAPLPVALARDAAGSAATVTIVVLLTLVLPGLWLRRALYWRRAAQAPRRRYRAHLRYSWGRGGVAAVPWLVITERGRTWYQRVMWERWVEELAEDLVIEGRRAGAGPFVVDVPGFGRLWPASRALSRQPLLEYVSDRWPDRRQSRVAGLVGWLLVTGAVLAIPMLGFRDQSAVIELALVVIFSQVWLLILYVGGSPLPVPGTTR